SALAQLARQDERSAEMARMALHTLAPDRKVEQLTQHTVQRFCWYELPLRFPESHEDRLFAARSLGNLFSLLQLYRYAQICQGPETSALLTVHHENNQAGRAMYERLMWESGVAPPDLPELTWGTAVGDAELRARRETAAALELAISLGDIRPGKRGWRPAQERFARSFLTQPDDRGLSHLDRIREERVRAWLSSSAHPHRQRLWPLVGQIIAGADVPRAAESAIAPLQLLLDLVAVVRSIPLPGYISLIVVLHSFVAFVWPTTPTPARSGVDATHLISPHQILRGMRTIRLSGRRLVLTRRGHQIWESTEAL